MDKKKTPAQDTRTREQATGKDVEAQNAQQHNNRIQV